MVDGKPSKVELVKIAGAYLRGTLGEEVSDSNTPQIGEDAATLLKFHGSYQQDDRDMRQILRKEGKDKAFDFMVRTRIPGGKLSAEQYLAHDELARELGNGTLRITTRQEFQLHGILKRDLKSAIQRINAVFLSTLAACGDVERNVLCCPAPLKDDEIRSALQSDCDAFASHCAPRSSSYFDIWLDGERVDNPLLPKQGPSLVTTSGDDPIEPIYGKAYLPRKFKSAFTLPEENCVDAFANDLAFIGVVEKGRLIGYNVAAGGGLGTTPSAGKTFPALAQTFAFIEREDCLRVGEAIIKVYRDLGNRSDRKRARLKYVIHDMGLPAFRKKVEEYLGYRLADPKSVVVREVEDHLGWNGQGDGKLWLGLPVENGRIKDEGTLRLATALRCFFQKYATPARLTCQQSILLGDIPSSARFEIAEHFRSHGVALAEDVSQARRWSMACPAFPTCGLAVTEAERALPDVMTELEFELERLGLADERFTTRMTGCPNGCARPYNAEIGLVGRSATRNEDGTPGPGTYTIFLGGSTVGDRLNAIFKDYVPIDRVVPELVPILRRFNGEKQANESFGDFCRRIGVESLPAPSPVASSNDPQVEISLQT
ncbi:MAG: NADPH-dependent assimilatory sulfite reductase hemoprotein subunit [Isosphaeraceae bacterium]